MGEPVGVGEVDDAPLITTEYRKEKTGQVLNIIVKRFILQNAEAEDAQNDDFGFDPDIEKVLYRKFVPSLEK